MDTPGWFEVLLAGIIAVGVIFLFRGGIRHTLEQSRKAPKDWAGALLPIGLVVLFVIFLITLVR